MTSAVESLRFPSPRGQRLAACLHRPADRPPTGAVVVAHGMLSSKDSPKHQALADRLAAAGFAALRFDFTGLGESEGSQETLTVSREIEDLRAALQLLEDLLGLPAAVVGSSLGGTVAVLAAADRDDLRALVTISAPARLPHQPHASWDHGRGRNGDGRVEVARGTFLRREFFDDAARHDVVLAARAVRCPWLVVHGERDDVVPPADGHLLAAAARDAVLVAHPEAGHRFQRPELRRWLVDTTVDFLARTLASS